MPKLTKTIVDKAIPREKQFTIWCSELKGFGVFVQSSGTRTYFVDYRNVHGVRKRMTIGRHGPLTVEQARKLAMAELGGVVTGRDPADDRATRRRSVTVRELCEDYLAMAEKGLVLGKGNRPKKMSTLYTDRGRINRHIVPLLGSTRVVDLSKADINRFLRDVASGKTAKVEKTMKRGKSIVKGGAGTAARTTGLLSGIISFAVDQGIIETNPVHGVKRPADARRRRRLGPEEYGRLGQALAEARAKGETPQLIDAVWLLALTGCRLGEIIHLKHAEVDRAGGCLRLEDKEGASLRPIGRTVLDYLTTIEAVEDCPTVLAPVRDGQVFGGMARGWKRIAKKAKLEGVTPHTLRHSFASAASELGYTEPTIAAMLGHAAGSITSRYIHHLDSVLISAADNVAATIHAMMVFQPEEAQPDSGALGSRTVVEGL
ncbi:site-specific integrase [Mesorhizobium sp. M0954]|uniref:tyrosine-type recombinase/integrase n=1 Tax=Mesorhizobium sp. M0954 TaxID=2957032 RepID=UPI003337F964